LGPLAFIIKINQLTNVDETLNDDQNGGSEQDDIVIFMHDDATLSEMIDVTNHVSGNCIGNSQNNIDNIIRFTENEQRN
jgi:hypothetical protein